MAVQSRRRTVDDLQEALRAIDMTIEEFAKAYNVSGQSVTNWRRRGVPYWVWALVSELEARHNPAIVIAENWDRLPQSIQEAIITLASTEYEISSKIRLLTKKDENK
jgi:hypothetical protein